MSEDAEHPLEQEHQDRGPGEDRLDWASLASSPRGSPSRARPRCNLGPGGQDAQRARRPRARQTSARSSPIQVKLYLLTDLVDVVGVVLPTQKHGGDTRHQRFLTIDRKLDAPPVCRLDSCNVH